MAEDFNTRVIREFRENDGRVGEPFTGLPMILVHHVGAKSGAERIAPLRWFADGDRWVVVASAAGAPRHPAWFHNLMANPDVTAEIADGKENNGGFADYERRTDRTIPLVGLTRR